MHEPAPHLGDQEPMHRAPSHASTSAVEPDVQQLRASIEAELAATVDPEAARGRFLAELAELSSTQQRELVDIVRVMDDPADALMPALEVIAPGGPLQAAAIAEAFLADELLQKQWQFAYDTLRSI